MPNALLYLIAFADIAFVLWFILTMNRLKANSQELVELARNFIESADRKASPAPIEVEGLHDEMSAADLAVAIENAGGRFRLLDDVMGVTVVLDNPKTVGPVAVRLVKSKNKALVQLFRSRSTR